MRVRSIAFVQECSKAATALLILHVLAKYQNDIRVITRTSNMRKESAKRKLQKLQDDCVASSKEQVSANGQR